MRKLLYVPIIHMGSDLGSAASVLDLRGASLCGEDRWVKHKETVAKFWDSLADYFAAVDASDLKIYQDGLPADGELGKKIVEEGAKRGSKNYQIILELMGRGAKIIKTENPSLLQEEYEHITEVTRSELDARKAGANVNYQARRNQLTKERDKFIAKTVDETLKEGETGVLFMGSYHNILAHLPKDILIKQVKEREKVNAYFKELISKGNAKRLEELAKYLAAPCES